MGVSNADGTTPVPLYATPTGHRLLVSGVGTTGPTGPTGADSTVAGPTGPTGPTGPDAYTTSSASFWQTSSPTTFTDAVDRIAAAVVAGTTGPIA